MINKSFYAFALLIMFCGLIQCHDSLMSKTPKTVIIQPLGEFPHHLIAQLKSQLKTIIPNVVVRPNMDFPKQSHYAPRNRYRADSLIKHLKSITPKDQVMVGISTKDISTTLNGITDWGVMGLGYRPGNACVVSTFRLSKSDLQSQFFKVVLHELGHTQGLNHCPNKTCFMRDAEGQNHNNELHGFCKSCQSHLINKGWNLAYPLTPTT